MHREKKSKGRIRCEVLVEAEALPEEDEIVIVLGGKVLIDDRNPLDADELGEEVDRVLCG